MKDRRKRGDRSRQQKGGGRRPPRRGGAGGGSAPPRGGPPPPLERVDETRWRIPRHGGMRTDGIVFATDALMAELKNDPCLHQVKNVAHLPGIVGPSLAMPDIHWGYGFPIGGVAATDPDAGGVVSPGGVGYDINCGVRLLRSDLRKEQIEADLPELADALFHAIPSGVGSSRKDIRFDRAELRSAITGGAPWAVSAGLGRPRDSEVIEEGGRFPGADPDAVTERAYARGSGQMGTLGSGNHFCEVGWLDEVYDEALAARLGLFRGQVTVIVHTGSRGFGHQLCTDFIEVMERAVRTYGIDLPDRQLCCAPVNSPEGQRYLRAMACAVNFAFANRQIITHFVREAFERTLGAEAARGMDVVYDVCHNIAKMEQHRVGGDLRRLCVHRKGATRSLPAGHQETPPAYRDVGQPVLIPGDMGRYSYVLVGTDRALEETFGSTCHGAGRVLSRSAAMRKAEGRDIGAELSARGIILRAASRATVAEEMPEAYKDVADVVSVVAKAGLSKLVARHRPMAVVKG